jgi:hypothetical protein
MHRTHRQRQTQIFQGFQGKLKKFFASNTSTAPNPDFSRLSGKKGRLKIGLGVAVDVKKIDKLSFRVKNKRI